MTLDSRETLLAKDDSTMTNNDGAVPIYTIVDTQIRGTNGNICYSLIVTAKPSPTGRGYECTVKEKKQENMGYSSVSGGGGWFRSNSDLETITHKFFFGEDEEVDSAPEMSAVEDAIRMYNRFLPDHAKIPITKEDN